MNKMKLPALNKFHFPTALGLLILLVAVGIGIFLVKSKTGSGSGNQELTPKQVRLTNISDTGFAVSWVTDQPATGQIKLGADPKSLKNKALDDRDQLSGDNGSFTLHHISAKNLKANTKYYFKIESGGRAFDNQGKPFEITTGPTLGNPPPADPIYGTVLSSSGTPAEGVIVYVNLANAAPLSALVKSGGNWALSLATARTTDLKSFLNYDTQATIVNLLVQGGKQGTAPAITTTANDSPVPDITLGQSHDFRNLAQSTPAASPAAGLSQAPTATPGSQSAASGFSLEPLIAQTETATDSGEVTLENPMVDGEVINATQPAFIGSGPPGTVLAITINSPQTYTGTATVDEDGAWEFIPPAGLEPGEHSITIAYLDAEGIQQTLSRNFIVAAAGDSDIPAIVATPSADTNDDTDSDTGRTSMPSTAAGIPQPGGGEISLLLLLTGIGLIISGIAVKKVV